MIVGINNIYDNRWWLFALFVTLLLAYLPVFQYDYLAQDDYSEIFNQLGFTQFLMSNGRIFQYVIAKVFHYILIFTGYHAVVLKILNFILVYLFALVLFLFLLHLRFKHLSAMLLTFFMFTTMTFSLLVQWIEMSFINCGNLYACVIFCFTWFYYDRCLYGLTFNSQKKVSFLSLFMFLVFISFLLSFTAMFGQPAIFVPLLFVTLSLLFGETRGYCDNDTHGFMKVCQLIKLYQREIFIIASVALGCIFYAIFWKLQAIFFQYLHDNHLASFQWNRSFGRDFGYSKSGFLTFIFSELYSFIKFGSYYSTAYFNIGNLYIMVAIFVFILVTIIIAIYKEIFKSGKTIYCVKWGLVVISILGASALNILEPTFRTGYIFSMLILIAFIYSCKFLFDFTVLLDKVSNLFNVCKKEFLNYVVIIFISVLTLNSIVFNNFRGLVYSNSVEQLYIRAMLLNGISLNPNADTIYLKRAFNAGCYYGVCYDGFGMPFSSNFFGFGHSIVEYNIKTIGINKSFNVIKNAETYEEDTNILAKLDLNKTIIIDMQGLNDAFLATYGKK